jgi:membrane associated rhomboid family serine protease
VILLRGFSATPHTISATPANDAQSLRSSQRSCSFLRRLQVSLALRGRGDKTSRMANCTKHDDRETFLGCSACDRPFCFACLIQGPVGAKCRDCTRGISATATPRERATASANVAAKDKLLGLKVVVGAFLAANVMLHVQSTTNKSALAPYLIRHGEWWRLFTGAVACGSLPTIALTAAIVFWVGRLVARRTTHLEFFGLSLVSAAGGALVTVVAKPDSYSYSGLSLAGGVVAAYLVGRKRGALGVLTLPGATQGWMIYGVLFAGWTVLGALGSETGGLYSFAGGALAAAPLAWRMFDPFPTLERSRVPAAISAFVSVLLFGFTVVVSGSATSPPRPSPTLPPGFNVFSDIEAAEAETATAPAGWLKVAYWEDSADIGDFQTFELQCDPKPVVRNDTYGLSGSATESCDWLTANSEARNLIDDVDATCNQTLVWRLAIVGTLTSSSGARPVDARYEGGEGCGSAVSAQALEALLSRVDSSQTQGDYSGFSTDTEKDPFSPAVCSPMPMMVSSPFFAITIAVWFPSVF